VSSRTLTLLAAVVAALALAACGSSSSNKSTSGAASGGGNSQAASATTGSRPAGAAIKLGMICSCSGPQAAVLNSMGKVASAWADSVNSAGGINGHPVDLIVKDDGQNPATSLQDAKELVEQDHVMAIVGEVSLIDTAWANYVAQKGIPVVGGVSPEAPFLTNPDFYPSGTQLVLQTVGTIALASAAHKQHVDIMYCAESPICAQLVPLGQAAASLYGLKMSSGKISATAPSYTAPCLQAKGTGADALFVAHNSPVVQRVVDNCVQQGYKPLEVSQTNTATSAWLKDSNLNGTVLAGADANPFDPSLPAVKEMQDALNKYAPGLVQSSAYAQDDIYPWVGGKLFEAAAKAAKLTPSSTPADVKKGLYALKNETLGGLSAPLTFTPGKPAFVPCYFTQELSGGKFASLNADKPTCLTAAQSAALLKALHLG
jgi:branched-chain amino acid transport system substrate-binding protein